MGAELWGGKFTADPSESVLWRGGLGSGMRGLCWLCGQSLLEWGLGTVLVSGSSSSQFGAFPGVSGGLGLF